MNHLRLLVLPFVAALCLSACGSNIVEFGQDADALSEAGGDATSDVEEEVTADAGRDVTIDTGPDVARDTGLDSEIEAATDGAMDTPLDAVADMAIDAGPEVASDAASDLGLDAGLDTGLDAGPEVASDAGLDAALDAGLDSALDAGIDATLDAGADTGLDAGVEASIDAGVDAAPTLLPTVSATVPVSGGTGVAPNAAISATFSEAMDPTSLTPTTFTVSGPGATTVAGTLSFVDTTATFVPASALQSDAIFTVTITTGAKDLAGVGLASNYVWAFTTGATLDTTSPTVTFTTPANLASAAPLNTGITAVFSEAMLPATIDATSFTLSGPGATPVVGTVSFVGKTAIFQPTSPLAASTIFTATITTAAKDLGGNPLASDFLWTFTTGVASDTAPPTVVSTLPVSGASGVSLVTTVSAAFSKAMAPLSISSATYTLRQGLTTIPGAVTFDAATQTATFTPSLPLAAGLAYTATISSGVTDLDGNPLATPYGWTFTTVSAPPAVLTTTPTNGAIGVLLTRTPTATFNAAMNPATLSATTFTLYQGLNPVAGVVTYDASTTTATFTPSAVLGLGLLYTATITTGAQDVAGDPLAANVTWSFTTGACGATPIDLRSASTFAILAGSTVTSVGPTSVTGDLGVSPGTAVTGFPPATLVGALHLGDPTSAQAILDLTTAFNDAAGQTLCPVSVAGNLGGMTLAPGLYKSTSSLSVSSGDLTLDGQGDSTSVFLFQMASTFTTTAGRQIILTNGAKATNVYWQIGTSATFGTTSVLQGTFMADQSISMSTGATIVGRLLANIGAVTLDSDSVVRPAP